MDERSEIAGSFQGRAQNDVGLRTDILDSCPKAEGMMLLIRSMAPKVIGVDELGSEEDIDAMKKSTFLRMRHPGYHPCRFCRGGCGKIIYEKAGG